ncbi:GNAT family N-acetyltransferase [Pluralibacter sp.]|uniref:tRNA(Met) cytidine acetyltransferase TmcA n=1 Tax=Pluralibacter sp. TaxID=1920032 RepID=UPI0025D92653|nr:GNAT family N-acetyltransferase [Pluralibacter sp.]
MDALSALATQMAEEGIRRLLVLSGDSAWCGHQAAALRAHLGEDGLWIGPQSVAAPYCPPGALKTWLGREYRHAFFDAREGFDVAAFAALAGTLRAGSWLVLLVPDFDRWVALPDADSLRWSDGAEPIATPHFVAHFCRTVAASPQTVVWRQAQPFPVICAVPRPHWHAALGQPLREQAEILQALAAMPPGVAAVTAERGRGKSALAGMHLSRLTGTAIVTAPTRAATDVLATFAGEQFRFQAPDALLMSDERADWLIVDEAAAIPGPLLHKLVSRFPRTLLTTTVQGYEGTGRGFLLKFCARFSHLHSFTLEMPIRWAAGCPLEAVVSDLLLFDDSLPTAAGGGVQIQSVGQRAWRDNPALPAAMYRLLTAAHYRTSPLDLRRMMDAPGQRFTAARLAEGTLVGALWLVDEGGLSAALSKAVWAGYRRPRGNLVAQSLAAHGGSPLAATLTGRRISRIAVHPDRQREGLGRQTIAAAVEEASGCDYLSVSFGYTEELWRFWQRCGFMLVRLGTQREASSGCYTAMALYPLSSAGRQLAKDEQQRLYRDAPWLDRWREQKLAPGLPPTAILTDEDWLDAAGFAFAHRPLLAAAGSLNRLLLQVHETCPALRGRLQQEEESTLCRTLGLSGRKALLARMREEAGRALLACDPVRTAALCEEVAQLQFFSLTHSVKCHGH